MANHTGREGTVKVGANTIAELRSWSIEESNSPIDDTELQDTWMTKKPGTNSWSGSAECYWDETDAVGQGALVSGAEITLNVYPEGDTAGDSFFTGSAIVTTVSRTGANDGMVEATFSFEGNGALTLSTV